MGFFFFGFFLGGGGGFVIIESEISRYLKKVVKQNKINILNGFFD